MWAAIAANTVAYGQIFQGTWESHLRSGGDTTTAGAVLVYLTVDGQVSGNVWRVGEPVQALTGQTFTGQLNSRGTFHVRLTGGGRLRGKIDGYTFSGRLLYPGRAGAWSAQRYFPAESGSVCLCMTLGTPYIPPPAVAVRDVFIVEVPPPLPVGVLAPFLEPPPPSVDSPLAPHQ
jgi:hypothetical protein